VVELGLNPLFERRKAHGVPKFREATAKVLSQHRKTCRNEKHEAQWLRTREADGTDTLRRTKASIIHRATGNRRAVQMLLAHTVVRGQAAACLFPGSGKLGLPK
jgi:hypothetical protein